ncbi:MAG: hypothetical protein ACKOBV_11160 [Candidatus Kapaibacterium sp.]
MPRNIALAIFAYVLLTCESSAQGQSDGYSAHVLLRSFGARAAGLSGAYTSAVNEPNAVFINPAALSGLAVQPLVSTSHSMLGLSRSVTLLSAAQNLTHALGLGVGLAVYNGGEFTRTDAAGNSVGTSTYTTYTAQAGMGVAIASSSLGVTAKYIESQVTGDGHRGTGFAFDLGARIPFGRSFVCGITARNIGSMSWNNSTLTRDALPWSIRAGVSTEIATTEEQYVVRTSSLGALDTTYAPSPTYLLLTLEAAVNRGAPFPTVTVGSEYAMTEVFAVRGGVALIGEEAGSLVIAPLRSLAGGVSYKFLAEDLPFNVSLDYGVTASITSATGMTHHLALTAAF